MWNVKICFEHSPRQKSSIHNRQSAIEWHPRRKAVLYASDPAYLDAVLAEEKGWRELAVPSMSLVIFRREDLSGYSVEPFEFIAQERKGAG